MELLKIVNDYLLLSALIPLGLFIFYLNKVNWRGTKIGVSLMLSKIATFAYLCLACFTIFTDGDFVFREQLRTITYIPLLAAWWYIFVTQIQIQKEGKATEEKLKQTETSLKDALDKEHKGLK
jgi:hypothetical protein